MNTETTSSKNLLHIVEQNREHLDAIRRNLGVPDDGNTDLDLRIILLCLRYKAGLTE